VFRVVFVGLSICRRLQGVFFIASFFDSARIFIAVVVISASNKIIMENPQASL
jgi:hypothetical protein